MLAELAKQEHLETYHKTAVPKLVAYNPPARESVCTSSLNGSTMSAAQSASIMLLWRKRSASSPEASASLWRGALWKWIKIAVRSHFQFHDQKSEVASDCYCSLIPRHGGGALWKYPHSSPHPPPRLQMSREAHLLSSAAAKSWAAHWSHYSISIHTSKEMFWNHCLKEGLGKGTLHAWN